MVSVIVSKCVGKRIYGDRLFYEEYETLSEAFDVAWSHVNHERSVVLRPNYNEKDSDGVTFFREWRSFNGGNLTEVTWKF